MIQIKQLLAIFLVACPALLVAQTEGKMNKHFSVSIPIELSSRKPIFLERKNPQKHGWEETEKQFENAFISVGFNVVDKEDTNVYVIKIDYDYGYVISRYRMQYSNFVATIYNNSVSVGSFAYDGKYENDELSILAAKRIKQYFKETDNVPKVNIKSKEDKLRELKDLFDKGLVSKEEYDRQVAKILEQQ